MEVGAVKQAFNNEVIQLKKKLNQAKIQTIHKLTRKAKQLTEKKAPEKLMDKLKRKSESAVNEVLIIKKIKARDIAKFIVTHTGELKTYLNKPQVDHDKACARLLLHKSMQEKYKFIRTRFNNVPIKDLFMSRQERLKLKKEAKEKQKNKKKDKNKKVVNAEGNWNVEDVDDEIIERTGANIDSKIIMDDENMNVVGNDMFDDEEEIGSENESIEVSNKDNYDKMTDDDDVGNENHEQIVDKIDGESNNNCNNESNSDGDEKLTGNVGKFVKLKPVPEKEKHIEIKTKTVSKIPTIKEIVQPNMILDINKTNKAKKLKDSHKNRNLKEKIQQKKFKKSTEDNIVLDNKVVDPFFITSSGEHYLTLAEPRQPDEVKEVHKQGNRQFRRAAMFGHELKMKPRNNFDSNKDFRNNDRFGKDSRRDNRKGGFNDRNGDSYDRAGGFNSKMRGANDRKGGFSDSNGSFSDRKGGFNNKYTKFNDNDTRICNKDTDRPKDEKLHPSWEAKKRQSGILPFQGKKIVFDES